MADSRRIALWALAALTLVGVVVAARVDDGEPVAANASRRRAPAPPSGVVATVPGLPRAQGAPSEPAAIDLRRLARAPLDAGAAEGIASAWQPAPAPPPTPADKAAAQAAAKAPPPPPAPPPLQFRAFGRLVDGDTMMAFVQSGQVTHVVKRGDILERIYRIEEVTDKQVTLTYLPLKLQQQLVIGAAQ